MHSLLKFALPILLIVSQATQAAVYQWTDANGQTHFGDRPPSQAQTREVAVDAASSGSHTIHFVVSEAQLPEMVPNEHNHEYVVTRYLVRSLELTFQIKVWDRQQETYTIREVSQQLTDLDIKHHASR
jgi:hypothetical protein